jgi:hypothetical protein
MQGTCRSIVHVVGERFEVGDQPVAPAIGLHIAITVDGRMGIGRPGIAEADDEIDAKFDRRVPTWPHRLCATGGVAQQRRLPAPVNAVATLCSVKPGGDIDA